MNSLNVANHVLNFAVSKAATGVMVLAYPDIGAKNIALISCCSLCQLVALHPFVFKSRFVFFSTTHG